MDSQTNKPSAAGGVPALDRRIADLRHELSMLEAEQRAQERQHRADVLRAMKELLLQHGFKPSELNSARATKATKSTGGRTQVAPLYRDPATGTTWSGRGTEPAWIKGRDRQAFKVAG
jgi:DNA-binding protein H-NS